MREQKTKEDVIAITKLAIENGVEFIFADKPSGKLCYSTTAIITKEMDASSIYKEIARKLKDKGVNVNEALFNEVKGMVDDSKIISKPC